MTLPPSPTDSAAPTFTCECPLEPGETRRLFKVTDHNGAAEVVRYCATCEELAGVDWNGETAKIEPIAKPEAAENPILACAKRLQTNQTMRTQGPALVWGESLEVSPEQIHTLDDLTRWALICGVSPDEVER